MSAPVSKKSFRIALIVVAATVLIAGGIAAAHHVRLMAKHYGVAVILHTDHAAKKLLPWIDGLLDAGEEYFKANGEPLFSSHCGFG